MPTNYSKSTPYEDATQLKCPSIGWHFSPLNQLCVIHELLLDHRKPPSRTCEPWRVVVQRQSAIAAAGGHRRSLCRFVLFLLPLGQSQRWHSKGRWKEGKGGDSSQHSSSPQLPIALVSTRLLTRIVTVRPGLRWWPSLRSQLHTDNVIKAVHTRE